MKTSLVLALSVTICLASLTATAAETDLYSFLQAGQSAGSAAYVDSGSSVSQSLSGAETSGGYSLYNFIFFYTNGSGDYYYGYVYAPTDLITDGTTVSTQPNPMGGASLESGYYYFYSHADGYDASYDGQEYIYSYYDGDTYATYEGVNGDCSNTAGYVYVADRKTTEEHGYVATNSQIDYIPYETKSGYVTASGGYAWSYSYEIGFFADFSPSLEADGPKIVVEEDIQLTGDDPGSLKATWETGIESVWNEKYKISTGSESYPIEFRVDWVSANADQVVTVIDSTGFGDMNTWYTTFQGWGNDYQGQMAAHEFGHMLSLYDEYSTGATDPTNPVIDTSHIMGNLEFYCGVKESYYTNYLTWLEDKTGESLSLVAY